MSAYPAQIAAVHDFGSLRRFNLSGRVPLMPA
jgi:hypothetical protein